MLHPDALSYDVSDQETGEVMEAKVMVAVVKAAMIVPIMNMMMGAADLQSSSTKG